MTFCQSLFSTINWKRCSLLTCQRSGEKGAKDDKDQAQADMELPQIEEFDAEYAMLIWKSPSRYRTGLQEFARDLARAQEKLTTLFDTTWTDETKRTTDAVSIP